MIGRRRQTGAWAAVAATLAICAWRLAAGDPISDGLESRLWDLRFTVRGAAPPPASVAIVALDEAAVARIPPGAPMRAALARAVAALSEAGAGAIAIDLLLVARTDADGALAAALAATPRAALAIAATGETADRPPAPALAAALSRSALRVVSGGTAKGTSAPPALIAPADALAAAATLGHVNVTRDPDRVHRRLPLAIDAGGGRMLPALPLSAARLTLSLPAGAVTFRQGGDGARAGVRIGDRFIAGDPGGRLILNHLGPAGTVLTVPLLSLLAGPAPASLAGRAVFLGATAESLGDLAATPFGGDVAGVETLAAAAAQLIDGRGFDAGPLAGGLTLALALAGAAMAGAAARLRRVGLAAAATLAVWALTAGAVQAGFLAHIWIDATAALGATLAASLWFWALGRGRDRGVAAALAPHVSALLATAERLGPAAARPLPGCAVFVDLEGSATLAESIGADEAGSLLGAVQRLIAEGAEAHGGVVAEVMGDGALAVFGLGDRDPRPGARAALAFGRAMATARDVAGGPRLRASAHHGPMALTDLGGAGRRHLTVIGDTVNVAARLQDVAKRHGTAFAVSRALVDAAGGDAGFAPLSTETLRGRAKPLEVWSPTPR
ncbi:MAG: adenylate cyclase [Paracoccaceae bacterium]|jgi:adenylate cyclase